MIYSVASRPTHPYRVCGVYSSCDVNYGLPSHATAGIQTVVRWIVRHRCLGALRIRVPCFQKSHNFSGSGYTRRCFMRTRRIRNTAAAQPTSLGQGGPGLQGPISIHSFPFLGYKRTLHIRIHTGKFVFDRTMRLSPPHRRQVAISLLAFGYGVIARRMLTSCVGTFQPQPFLLPPPGPLRCL